MQGKELKSTKTLAFGVMKMYQKTDRNQLKFYDFIQPFGGKLDINNRWVKLSEQINWDYIEDGYASLFGETGNPAKTCRVAFGSLLIQEKLHLTDKELVLQLTENPYLQYFIGNDEYSTKPPFTSPALVSFRKRFTAEMIAEINEGIFIKEKDDDEDNDGDTPNKGVLIIDATCAPADIAFPTDHELLNQSRKITEEIIDVLHKPDIGTKKRPRTYRKKARKSYLNLSRSKRKTTKAIRKAIRYQLECLTRNLRIIDNYKPSEDALNNRYNQLLQTIRTIYEQQKYMYTENVRSVPNRIVNLYQPYVRPIVRGKARAKVEFGSKIAISIVNGYTFIDKISFDSFNEGSELEDVLKNHKKRFGCYPTAIMADKIYRSSGNLALCKELGIRLSGPKLGRPTKNDKEERKQERIDTKIRNQVEGKFGEGKRKYGLDLVMTKLEETSKTAISIKFLVMNLERRLRVLFAFFENRANMLFGKCYNVGFCEYSVI